ncbi:MAG: transcriptional repressor LexA [Candidatus Dadabacteria bacterium]|nr:MAG: transcriptional repressor LexA [Candidatus Dadabacteria bacterium]
MGRTPAGQTRKRIYEFVRRRLLEGTPPTVREVQQAFGFRAVQTAREHLEALVREGLLAKAPGRARGYYLPPAATPVPTRLVPLVGRVQAGQLTAAIESPEGYLALRSRRPERELFALRVRGDSMSGAGILDGDIVVVRRQRTAEDGEIVVALVGDEATVKRLRRRGRRVELRPENPAFDTIVVAAEEVTILGKVIEVHRYLEHLPLIPAP